jgi:serine protease Do
VDEKSDAWTQGIRPGDILLAADGVDITGTQDLIRLKQCLGAGDAVELTYLRDGEIVTVPVTLVDTNLIS